MEIYKEFVGKLVDVHMNGTAYYCESYIDALVLEVEGSFLKLGIVRGGSPKEAKLKREKKEFSMIRVVNGADGVVTYRPEKNIN